jgi:hypothetical protein
MSESDNLGTSVWLRGPLWDGFWLLSGLWLFPLVLALGVIPNGVAAFLLLATALLWLAHRFGTMYSAFCCPAYRELVWEQRQRFIFAPLAIFALTFVFSYLPDDLLSPLAKLQVLGSIFFVINSYHFGVQHYGVLTIYRIRAGQSATEHFKETERRICLTLGGGLIAVGQLCHGAEVVQESLFAGLIPLDFVARMNEILRLCVPLLVGVLIFKLIRHELGQEVRSTPKVAYILGLGLQSVCAFFLEPFSFLVLWAVQHWLVSVGLAAHMAQNDKTPLEKFEGSLWYRVWAQINRRFWLSTLLLAMLSVILTPLLRVPINYLRGLEIPAISAWLIPYLEFQGILQFLIALNFASVYAHFVYDRAVFRFSNASVRKVSGPLLFSK